MDLYPVRFFEGTLRHVDDTMACRQNRTSPYLRLLNQIRRTRGRAWLEARQKLQGRKMSVFIGVSIKCASCTSYMKSSHHEV